MSRKRLYLVGQLEKKVVTNPIDYLKLKDATVATVADPSNDYLILLKRNTGNNQLELKKISPNNLGTGGANQQRATANFTVSSGQTVGSIILSKTILLIYITTNQPCRLRLYSSATSRNSDLSRPVSTFPNTNSGLMFEFVAVSGLLAAPISPGVVSFNAEQPVVNTHYYTVDSDTAVDITLTYIPIE
jgi:hypothetical protein